MTIVQHQHVFRCLLVTEFFLATMPLFNTATIYKGANITTLSKQLTLI